MLKEVLETISKRKCNKIITTEKIYNNIKGFFGKEYDFKIFDDLRSASFFALGNSSLDKDGTILIIDGDYLPNIYTSMTEAWFQRKQIIVIAIYEKYKDIKCEYIKRCMPNIINVYSEKIEDYQKEIDIALKQNYPCLINIVEKKDNIYEEKNDYEKILKKFDNFLKHDNEVFIYNSIEKEYNYNFTINNIEMKYKYGILSKYVGYVTAKNEKTILCIPSEILKIDLNIFNNRYTNSNIKIISLGNKENEETVSSWIKENKIDVKFFKDITENELKEFYDSDKPEIIFIGGI